MKCFTLALLVLSFVCFVHCDATVTPPKESAADGAVLSDQGTLRQDSSASDTAAQEVASPDTSRDTSTPQDRGTPDTATQVDVVPETLVDTPATTDRGVVQDVLGQPDVASPTACQGLSPMSGESTWRLKHDGVNRSFLVFLPPQYDAKKPLPLVLNFHGLAGSSAGEKSLSKMNDLAKTEGFIVVYPQGRGLPASWNAGKCCAPASSSLKSKDVAFVNAMLDELQQKLCVDKRRIFSTGMSNGGHMSYRLACELSDRIAAFAPVAAVLLASPCQPKRPVPLIAFHGTSDAIVPFKGSTLRGYPSVQESIDFWVKHNGCRNNPAQSYQKGDSTCKRYSGCQGNASVEMCVVDKGGHTWPGGSPFPLGGRTTKDLSATAAMWKFFQQHPLP